MNDEIVVSFRFKMNFAHSSSDTEKKKRKEILDKSTFPKPLKAQHINTERTRFSFDIIFECYRFEIVQYHTFNPWPLTFSALS